MTKTILELAEELNVSKQAIRYHFSDIDEKYFGKRKDGAILISHEAETIIRKNMDKPLEEKVESTDKKIVSYQEETIRWLLSEIEAKNDQINNTNKQIERKDDQIDSLSQRIQELTTLISRDQVLLERTIQPIESDTTEKNDVSPESKENFDEDKAQNDDAEPISQKKKWWQRLFNK